MNYTTEIDTIKLQTEFFKGCDQRAVLESIVHTLLSTHSYLYIQYNTKNYKGMQTHTIYTAGTKILELKTGSYLNGSYRDTQRITIFYLSIEIAGLKRYDTKIDTISYDCLVRVCAHLNTNTISFGKTGLDICVDIRVPFENTYGFCNMRSSGVNYYKVGEAQSYPTTHYIEKYDHTHTTVMKRAYLYDKRIKEENISYALTRFELKLQARLFNKHPFTFSMLKSELDKYHILYFPTLEEKAAALLLYAQYEDTIRRRDLHKLGLDRYRIYPNVQEIERFLFSLYDVYEADLVLPVSTVDNGFDWSEFE